jgi:hypothetical protein
VFAFGKRIALTNNPVVVRATAASALPKNQQIFGGPEGDYRLDLWSCRSAQAPVDVAVGEDVALKCGYVARFERGDVPAGGDEVANDLQRTQVSDLKIKRICS